MSSEVVMSDDIDIEEHDILDNPVIKNMFPDLSVLKKEILDNDDGTGSETTILAQEPNASINSDVGEAGILTRNPSSNSKVNTKLNSEDTSNFKLFNQEHKNQLSNIYCNRLSIIQTTRKQNKLERNLKTRLPAKGPNEHISSTHLKINLFKNSSHKQSHSKHILKNVICPKEGMPIENYICSKSYPQVHPNKIILGSKISLSCKQNNVLEKNVILNNVQVSLIDCAPLLFSSDRYCPDCRILFNTYIGLEFHKKNAHHNYIDTRNENKKMVTEIIRDHKCLICNISFTTKHTLNKHKIEKHSLRNSLTLSNINSSTLSSDSNYGCFHCSKHFLDQKSLIEHLYNVLQMKCPSSSNSSLLFNKVKQKKRNNDIKLLERHTHNIEKEEYSIINFKDNSGQHKYMSKSLSSVKKKDAAAKVNVSSTKGKPTNLLDLEHKEVTKNSGNIKEQKTLSTDVCNLKKRKISSMKEKCDTVITRSVKQKTTLAHNNAVICNKNSIKLFYECMYCSYYFNKLKYFKLHLKNKHKVKNLPKIQKVTYKPKCKYCLKISDEMIVHNVHLQKHHKDKIQTVIKDSIDLEIDKKSQQNSVDTSDCNIRKPHKSSMLEQVIEETSTKDSDYSSKIKPLILKSVLYKCSKCEVHFLSLQLALNHSEHIEILINWKCDICMKILKKNDEALHIQQHLHSGAFTVYNTDELDISLILYKCSKCTIHYDETNYRRHYSNCELMTPNGSYCIACDILVDNNIIKFHEIDHNQKNIKLTNFTIIECDLLNEEIDNVYNTYESNKKVNSKPSKNSRKYKIRHLTDKMLLEKYFCRTCKCFVNNIGSLSKVHIQSRCQHLTKHICIYCGLLLTSSTIATHRGFHKRNPKISLQDFSFYEFKSRKKIKPPVPEYPKCEICNIYFMSKVAIKNHLCSENAFSMCKVCFKKLSKPIYKLHMAFHNYSLNTKSKLLSHNTISTILPISETIGSDTTSHFSVDLYQPPKIGRLTVFYRCRNCSTTLITYDEVIDHCHLHYSNQEHKIKAVTCDDCKLDFDIGCYERHKILHMQRNMLYKTPLEFDAFYFKFDNDIWTKHVFSPLPQNQINEILKQSIYRFEHRLIMNIVQHGSSDITLYKCNSCCCIIEPELIYKHIEIDCSDVRRFICIFCGLNFLSLVFKRNHEKIHNRQEMNSKTFRVVLFNQNEHKSYNSTFAVSLNYYILYQCRICKITIQKFQRNTHKCSENATINCTECKLLFDKNEYELHVSKHKEFDNFNTENIKVILFGTSSTNNIKNADKKLLSFCGTVYDYTFYRCTNCNICVRNVKSTFLHICSPSNYKINCPKCGLHFHCNSYKIHHQSHIVDPDFEIENINIISFDAKNSVSISQKDGMGNSDIHLTITGTEEARDTTINIESSSQTLSKIKESSIIEARNIDVESSLVTIFKCTDCDLNFLDEASIKIHFTHCGPKIKLPKQTCTKCDLLFTPNTLFTHLLIHHGHKNEFKYEIVELTKTLKCSK
ncbi:zinc finger protein 423-like [Achroia grisella]|uniref:zinc finger protein 423-like n=1 Tax=Achroia grisella TaxID=688607 RepID=UPI0027D21813|nr:zinc finger protein 423-like [Achroia grisella]